VGDTPVDVIVTAAGDARMNSMRQMVAFIGVSEFRTAGGSEQDCNGISLLKQAAKHIVHLLMEGL